MSKPPLRKVEEETRTLEKIMLEVPGFKGYKAKELRREADRLVRDSVYRRLKTVRADLESIFQTLSDNRLTQNLEEFNRLMAKVDRISEQFNHASYGYSGFFDAVKIEEDDLDNMLSFDLGLLDQIVRLADATNQLKATVKDRKFDLVPQHLATITTHLEQLQDNFEKREEIIKGVSL